MLFVDNKNDVENIVRICNLGASTEIYKNQYLIIRKTTSTSIVIFILKLSTNDLRTYKDDGIYKDIINHICNKYIYGNIVNFKEIYSDKNKFF